MATLADLLGLFSSPSQQPSQSLGSLGSTYGQRVAQQDGLSPEAQYLAHQQMLANRNATSIQTIDPGRLWGGLDKNAVDPNDVMRAYFEPWARQDNI